MTWYKSIIEIDQGIVAPGSITALEIQLSGMSLKEPTSAEIFGQTHIS